MFNLVLSLADNEYELSAEAAAWGITNISPHILILSTCPSGRR